MVYKNQDSHAKMGVNGHVCRYCVCLFGSVMTIHVCTYRYFVNGVCMYGPNVVEALWIEVYSNVFCEDLECNIRLGRQV